MDDSTLAEHANQASSEDLQAFIQNPSADQKLIGIAKQELANRDGNGDGDGNGMNENGDGNLSPEEQAAAEEELFGEFIEKYFEEHDKDDLEEYVIELVMKSNSKKKDLKEHFRTKWYPTKNGGNTVTGKIDSNEFQDFLEEYFDQLSFEDLKHYAQKMAKENPYSLKDLKRIYEDTMSM